MKTCLVVDDSSVIRKVARRILEGLDFKITEAEDGQQALEQCRSAMPVRGLVSRWIDEEPGLKTVASLRNGREAVDQLLRHNPDVVLLDIDMPDLDGIEALPLLLEKKRDLVVIMASTLTRRNAEVSLRALSLGAADYIPKPATNREVTTSAIFRRELIEKVRQLGLRKKRDGENARARPRMG